MVQNYQIVGQQKGLKPPEPDRTTTVEENIGKNSQVARAIFNQPLSLTNYLCHWSQNYRFVYVETPKVACTTVKRVLQQAEAGNGLIYKQPGDVHDRSRSPLLTPSHDWVEFVEAMQNENHFRFCFVRNPFTRLLSCYLDKMVKNVFERRRLAPKLSLAQDKAPIFYDFLRAISDQKDEERDIHWASQTYLLRPNRVRYSFIGRFELFREQFYMVCDRLGISEYAGDLSGSWHATNAFNKVKDYLGHNEIKLIHHVYENDFRNFGYGWSPEVI